MAKNNPELRAHKDWLGLLQPVGLVVSPPALIKAQAVPSQNVVELQQRLLSIVQAPPGQGAGVDEDSFIEEPLAFFETVLDWSSEDIAGAADGPPIPDGIELILPDYNETLRPTYVVVDSMGDGEPLLLVQVLPRGTSFDEVPSDEQTGWSATPQSKFERLLREVKIPVGLLFNGDALRLVYAPSGESSGHLTFSVSAMCEVGGRPIFAALHMLLSEHRVFSAPDGRRLLDILSQSRKYQAEVSNALSDQVLGALWELLRGFQASDPEDGQRVFNQTAREDPQHVYGGQLSLLMRLIFVLYAEDEGLMPEGEVYANNYSVSGLYDRLRSDAGRYPDTMDQRYGAYAWLLSLFRLIFDGGGHGGLHLPTRHGQLFNPDEFPFLEGRPRAVLRVMGETFEAPRVSDGCVYRVLDALLMLDGERLSYRALDVEQVGSVYEAMMGYEVERAFGRSIAVRPKHIVINIDDLLDVDGGKRKKWLKDQADSELSGAALKALKEAATPEEMIAALGRRVSPRSLDTAGTPRLMAPGTLYLQPGEERRRTGSHYTPRELTEPIVRTTLRPVLEVLGERPTADQILGLKVCDPAMGSGAFLVETTRQLAEHLVIAWELHDTMPNIPADEEPILHARRLVAQRCIYGVDKNHFAVNLAKLSIWLVTLAKDHAFTFIDHALKHGDSLVGLTKKQIAAFHWKTGTSPTMDLFEEKLKQNIEAALGWRDTLHGLNEGDYDQRKEAWWESENALADARLIGDLAVAAFFGGDNEKTRKELRGQYLSKVQAWQADEVSRHELEATVAELRGGEKPVPPMHWEIEFPEVFGGENPGFDMMVGNPPFLGGLKIETAMGGAWRAFLVETVAEGKRGVRGTADLCAYFFIRCYRLTRESRGSIGFIATNTIAQGDTRLVGLGQIVRENGIVLAAETNKPWPGNATVHFSMVSVSRSGSVSPPRLNGLAVNAISSDLTTRETAFLPEPQRLAANQNRSFQGSIVLGSGFLLSQEEASDLLESNSRLEPVVLPYMTGTDLNTRTDPSPSRWVINFWDYPLNRAAAPQGYTGPVAYDFPECISRIEKLARPEREAKAPINSWNRKVRSEWWLFGQYRWALQKATAELEHVLILAATSNTVAFGRVANKIVFSNALYVFAFDGFDAFALLQSTIHDCWARNRSSTMKGDLRYTNSAVFETFPFPERWQSNPNIESAGKTYYEFRADLMVRNHEGLTKTYNNFHDPDNNESDIVSLRELHAAMDRAVLDAYGWDDISTDCEFLLDYEIDEETWGTKKKPYRYRWPEAVHDEVLARLLDLNQKRYTEEVAEGMHDKNSKKKTPSKKAGQKRRQSSSNSTPSFFEDSASPPEEA